MATSKIDVTVGVPVRNGGATFRRAMESVVTQSHTNLAIIISDNGSTDDTAVVAAEFAARDSRIRYVRHDQPLSALENFRFLVEQAETEYFMWAAHDDFRSTNYIEKLHERLADNPEAVLSFGDIVQFSEESDDFDAIAPVAIDWGWEALSHYGRINNAISNKCSVMYGLVRTRFLKEYSWIHTEWGPDIPLLLYLRMRGEFLYTPGPTFYEWIVKGGVIPAAQRASNESLRKLRKFWLLRVAWACDRAALEAANIEGRRHMGGSTFVFSYVVLKKAATKLWLYPRLPVFARRLWHRFKSPQYLAAATVVDRGVPQTAPPTQPEGPPC